MIEGLLGLLTCQLIGEVLVRTLHLHLPGPVLGMLLLLAALTLRPPGEDHPVTRAGDRVLDELPLLFIPAGVGIVTVVPLLREQWLPIVAGLLVSWAVGLAVTAGAARLVARREALVGIPLDTGPTPDQERELLDAAEQLEGLDDDDERTDLR